MYIHFSIPCLQLKKKTIFNKFSNRSYFSNIGWNCQLENWVLMSVELPTHLLLLFLDNPYLRSIFAIYIEHYT